MQRNDETVARVSSVSLSGVRGSRPVHYFPFGCERSRPINCFPFGCGGSRLIVSLSGVKAVGLLFPFRV